MSYKGLFTVANTSAVFAGLFYGRSVVGKVDENKARRKEHSHHHHSHQVFRFDD
jgi:hypothetical protein